ncbi:MAG: prenyltransferase/squalene oxidase repeat-containing protein, partial [Thermoproteota archaeon]
SLPERIANYVLARRNEDGGYTSVQFIESNIYDTFLALAILKEINVEPPNVEQTINFLKSFPLLDLRSIYYVNKSLEILRQPLIDATEFIVSIRNKDGGFGTLNVDIESSSELETTFMAIDLLKMLDKTINDKERTIEFVLNLKNPDGGFGKSLNSNIVSTYYALSALSLLEYDVEKLEETKRYVTSCESEIGGFTPKPLAEPPFIEYTYFGVMALKFFKLKPKSTAKTTSFVLSCLNSNGGFRRSSEHGISSFEYTYYAISVLKELGVSII